MGSLQSLTAELDALSRTAEKRLHAQPRPTRAKFTAETRSIFQKYAQHGTQARLRHNVRAFLEAGDEGLKLAETSTPRTLARSASSQLIRRSERAGSSSPGGHVEGVSAPESRTVDVDSSDLIPPLPQGLDFHLDRSFVLNADITIPMDLLESMDRVFGLYAQEAKLLLSHHCAKYGNEAIFRAGIRELVMRYSLLCCELVSTPIHTQSPL